MCGEVFTDSELDQLYENVALVKPDSNDNECSSQVRLFAAVGSPTDEPLGETTMVLAEGSNGDRRPEGGPYQGPSLICIQKREIL